MGLSAAEGAQLLGQFEMAGMDTSAAMMGMKTALKNAADEGKSLGDAMKEWQDYMNSTASDTDKLTASIDCLDQGRVLNSTMPPRTER
jgi:phage-related minor tail protein